MKHLLSIILFCFSFSISSAASAEIDGRMSCQIKDQHIAVMKDGKSSNYGAFTDGVKVGDQLTFFYQIDEKDQLNIVLIEPKSSNRFIYAHPPKTAYRDGNDMAVDITTPFEKIRFGKNIIHLNNGNSTLWLKRYYKSDWNGIYTTNEWLSAEYAQILTMDCRHSDDQIEAVFNALRTK